MIQFVLVIGVRIFFYFWRQARLKEREREIRSVCTLWRSRARREARRSLRRPPGHPSDQPAGLPTPLSPPCWSTFLLPSSTQLPLSGPILTSPSSPLSPL